MTGYVDLSDPVEDPKPQAHFPKGKSSLDITADVRDLLSNVVGNNFQSWQEIGNSEDAKAQYSSLIKAVGRPLATKLLTQVISFNQRPDFKNQPLESRIKSFYDIGSADKEVSGVLENVKSAGYGVLPGFRESSHYGNQVLGGRLSENVTPTAESEKIKQIITAKTQK